MATNLLDEWICVFYFEVLRCVLFLQTFGGTPHMEMLRELFTQVCHCEELAIGVMLLFSHVHVHYVLFL